MKAIHSFFILSILYVSIISGCAGNKKLNIENLVLKSEGYYIEVYKYGFDSVAGNYGFWYYDRKFHTKEFTLPLAGDISNFSSVFNCEEFKKLSEYVKSKNETYGKSIFKNEDGCYFRDKNSQYLYYVVFAKGDFIYFKNPLCSKDKKSFDKSSNKAPCKYAPKQIRNYPFLVPVNYYSTDTTALQTAEDIIQNKSLERVRKDSLRFYICM